MKLIPLTQGMFAEVDDADFKWLNVWKWYAAKGGNTYYARRNIKNSDGKRSVISMHREIMNTPDGLEVDHKDWNGLNCQRYNLKNGTHGQNQANSKAFGTSVYLGVAIRITGRSKGLITAQIQSKGKLIYLGTFKTEISAAQAYDKAAKELHGEFANLNFK